MSADEAAEDVLEAWQLEISWTTINGEQHPTLKTTIPGKTSASLPIAAKPHYTMSYVRDASSALLRQLSALLEMVPALPTLHWLRSSRHSHIPKLHARVPRVHAADRADS